MMLHGSARGTHSWNGSSTTFNPLSTTIHQRKVTCLSGAGVGVEILGIDIPVGDGNKWEVEGGDGNGEIGSRKCGSTYSCI